MSATCVLWYMLHANTRLVISNRQASRKWCWGVPCPQCARSAKFCMSANTQILVLALFHKFVVP